mgnify:FL=1
MTTRILNAECAILEAAAEVLADSGTISEEEQATGIHGDIYAAINKLGGYDIARSTYRAQNGE